jgi:hypothetical protein
MLPWWFDLPDASWSHEERWAAMRIWLMATPIMPIVILLTGYILDKLGIDPYWSGRIAFLTGMAGGLYLARRICVWVWPETIKRADKKAAKRRG